MKNDNVAYPQAPLINFIKSLILYDYQKDLRLDNGGYFSPSNHFPC